MARRIAAVLATDMVGYSRLVSEDEEAALAELALVRGTIIRPRAEAFGGEIVKDMGDGWLALFPSAKAAVEAALAIQDLLSGHPTVKLRMGLHVADVVLSEADIFGNGVNLAARLEGLSAPGGLLISEAAFGNLSGALAAQFTDLGATSLKNLPGKQRLYGWGSSGALHLNGPEAPQIGLAQMPSIAVLPFDNLSRDPALDPFADGLAENLIASLSTSPNLSVTARNSSFVFKGRATPTAEIARTLGVRYLVEGSLQAQGKRARVTVQLIEAHTGAHLWADRYDRSLDDVFELQDEVSHRVCVELHVKLTYGVHVRHRCKDIESLTLFVTGRTHFNHLTPEGLQTAAESWTRFHERDPENPEGLCLMGWLAWMRVYLGLSADPAADLEAAVALGRRSIALDPSWGNGHRILGYTLLLQRDFEGANRCFDRALELNPADGEANSLAGTVRCMSGRYEEAEALFLKSIKLEPFTPTWIYLLLGMVRLLLGKHALARAGFEALSRVEEESFVQAAEAWLALVSSLEGREEEAARRVAHLQERHPTFTRARFHAMWLNGLQDEELARRLLGRLEAAGYR
jgi:TolB-like protein/Tfp pilus assembly protein PilF